MPLELRRCQVGRRCGYRVRIDHGPGYRVYYTRRGKAVVILLCGGDKRTQSKDIRKAKDIAETLED
ncbi:MAG TPA: type II toxin-antitoxin system RelE/ParE family toxin [Bradyrhizobium sp.]